MKGGNGGDGGDGASCCWSVGGGCDDDSGYDDNVDDNDLKSREGPPAVSAELPAHCSAAAVSNAPREWRRLATVFPVDSLLRSCDHLKTFFSPNDPAVDMHIRAHNNAYCLPPRQYSVYARTRS